MVDNKNAPSKDDKDKASPRLRALYDQFDAISVNNGELFRLFVTNERDTHYQWIVPEHMVPEVLQREHDDVHAAHLGSFKTQQRIQMKYFWPSWRNDVLQWCKTCDSCQRVKIGRYGCAPLKPRMAGRPWQIAQMDLIGPLPRSAKGYRYILVVTDLFTKYSEAFPLRNMEAVTVAKPLFTDLFLRVGYPEVIHTDQGRSFENEVWRSACEQLFVGKTRSSPFHPQGAGGVERLNRTIKTMLQSFVGHDNENTWDMYLPYVMSAYRSSVQRTTGYSPNRLTFGRELRGPADPIFHEHDDNVSNFAAKVADKVKWAHGLARLMKFGEQMTQKAYYDRKIWGKPFEAGDLVLVRKIDVKAGTTKKFHKAYHGPFSVIKKLSDANYLVAPPKRKK